MKTEDWIQAERIHHEMTATGNTVRTLRQTDPEFQVGLDLAVAALLRDPSGTITHVHRIASLFSDAIGRRAERDFNERSVA